MNDDEPVSWIAFSGTRCVAQGAPERVATEVKEYVERDSAAAVLIFDGRTSKRIELDLWAPVEEMLRRLPGQQHASASANRQTGMRNLPGRPKLGVVAREVTLLPRHWQWLSTQRGGASAALRRLVEQAARDSVGSDAARRAQDATYEFVHALAGDEPGYEEALRALFAGDQHAFARHVAAWPGDVREHALALMRSADENQ